jgi:hypothetical protein
MGISPRDVFPVGSTGAKPKPPIRGGVVYLLKCGVFFKIGKSISPKQRYYQLKIQLPEKCELVHEIKTNDINYTEKHWHRRFAARRANGEWFKLKEEDVDEFLQCRRLDVRETIDADDEQDDRV